MGSMENMYNLSEIRNPLFKRAKLITKILSVSSRSAYEPRAIPGTNTSYNGGEYR